MHIGTTARKALLREMTYREVREAGCATSSALMERLRTTRNELFYILDGLRREGRVESVYLGRIALWCTSRTAAETATARLADALKSLLCGRVKFATPKETLRFVAEDPEMRELFSRHMQLRSNATSIQVMDVLLTRAFGRPIETSRGHVYTIYCLHRQHAYRDAFTGIDSQG